MEWISVKDRLPEDRIPVLIYTSYFKMATAYCDFEGDFSNVTCGWIDAMRVQHSYGSVTHWMPLPEPPKED